MASRRGFAIASSLAAGSIGVLAATSCFDNSTPAGPGADASFPDTDLPMFDSPGPAEGSGDDSSVPADVVAEAIAEAQAAADSPRETATQESGLDAHAGGSDGGSEATVDAPDLDAIVAPGDASLDDAGPFDASDAGLFDASSDAAQPLGVLDFDPMDGVFEVPGVEPKSIDPAAARRDEALGVADLIAVAIRS